MLSGLPLQASEESQLLFSPPASLKVPLPFLLSLSGVGAGSPCSPWAFQCPPLPLPSQLGPRRRWQNSGRPPSAWKGKKEGRSGWARCPRLAGRQSTGPGWHSVVPQHLQGQAANELPLSWSARLSTGQKGGAQFRQGREGVCTPLPEALVLHRPPCSMA